MEVRGLAPANRPGSTVRYCGLGAGARVILARLLSLSSILSRSTKCGHGVLGCVEDCQSSGRSSILRVRTKFRRTGSSVVERVAHNNLAQGSIPCPSTKVLRGGSVGPPWFIPTGAPVRLRTPQPICRSRIAGAYACLKSTRITVRFG